MQASIQEIARLTGVTSRTLRHYDAVGLLPPTRTGSNGLRWYDEDALVRLQRILLLRDLGLGLPQIRAVLDRQTDETTALRHHLDWLDAEQQRLARQAASVRATLTARTHGETLMTEQMFDGFDHTQHKDEVTARWGADAYATSDAWWRGMSDAERTTWKDAAAALTQDWIAAASSGTDPASPQAQALAARHLDWLASIPGTPRTPAGAPDPEYVRGLGDMYVDDPRFAATYGGPTSAAFVRDALHHATDVVR